MLLPIHCLGTGINSKNSVYITSIHLRLHVILSSLFLTLLGCFSTICEKPCRITLRKYIFQIIPLGKNYKGKSWTNARPLQQFPFKSKDSCQIWSICPGQSSADYLDVRISIQNNSINKSSSKPNRTYLTYH